MSLNSDSFWKLLESSRLLNATTMLQLGQQLANLPAKEPEAISQKLVEQKLITSYQAEILLAGHAGPFHFGNYTIQDRYTTGPLIGQFKARHAPTLHPVCLTFLEGTASADLQRWQKMEQFVGQLQSTASPFLASFFDVVVMPNYRFIVSQRPEGVTLMDRLPRKARLPWKDACTLFSQVAHAVETLHKQGLAGGELCLENVWVGKSGFTQFRPELNALRRNDDSGEGSASESTRKDDWFRFGCCFYRSATGKNYDAAGFEQSVPNSAQQSISVDELKTELTQHGLPEELQSLCSQLLLPDAAAPISGRAVGKLLSNFSNKPLKSLLLAEPPTLVAFRKSITRFVPGSGKLVDEVPKLETGEPDPGKFDNPDKVSISIPEAEASSRQLAKQPSSSRSRKKKWGPIIATLLGIWAFCGLLGFGAYYASNQKTPNFASSNTTSTVDPVATASPTGDADSSAIANNTNADAKSSAQPPILTQQLIKDDRATLWQSPTEGAALDLGGLPAVPKIVIAIRPDELLSDPDGGLLIRSLGSDFAGLIEDWESQTGIPLAEIEQLVLSLHSNDQFRYESFVRCQLKTPIDASELMNRWSQPKPQATASGKIYYMGEGKVLGFVLLDGSGSKDSDDRQTPSRTAEADASSIQVADTITRFGFGNARLLAEVADQPQANAGGVIRALAERSDRQRHFNLLYLRPAVFNDEGQALMAEKWSAFNRELAELLPDEIQGGSLSLHLDRGTFLELQFAQTVDLKGVELLQRLQDRFRDLRDRTTQSIAAIPASPYWDRVRMKLSLMIVDVFRSLRWGVESGKVVANCWLPPMAAHNLIAATELAVSFSGGTAAASSIANPTAGNSPKTLDELLNIKRDLKVANPPDLNLLMADLEAEIRDEFPALPFQFRIRLLGPDLQVEGITQNQRPSELNMNQLPLNEILTAIMVSANPAKDIAGPADPRCKLVWAVADDPDSPGQKMIAITTRAAAEQKKYQLPPAFRIE